MATSVFIVLAHNLLVFRLEKNKKILLYQSREFQWKFHDMWNFPEVSCSDIFAAIFDTTSFEDFPTASSNSSKNFPYPNPTSIRHYIRVRLKLIANTRKNNLSKAILPKFWPSKETSFLNFLILKFYISRVTLLILLPL